MSEIAEYIEASVRGYLDNEIDTDRFREAFVGAYVCLRNQSSGDLVANRLAGKLMVPFAEFSGGHRSEQSMREEFANTIRPLVLSTISALKIHPSNSYAWTSFGSMATVGEAHA